MPEAMEAQQLDFATKYPELFSDLCSPFHPDEIKTRGSQRYVTAQTVENRLDEVLGTECWKTEIQVLDRGVVCRLSILLPDGVTWLTKSGVGGYETMSDPSDVIKSGLSDALKIAARAFGVGRYLWKCGVPDFARGRHTKADAFPTPWTEADDEEAYRDREKRDREVYDRERQARQREQPAPQRSTEGPPSQSRGREDDRGGNPPRNTGYDRNGSDRGGSRNGSGSNSRSGGPTPPRNGKELAGWSSKRERVFGDEFTKYRDSLLKKNNLPWKMLDLSNEDAVWVYEQLMREFPEDARN